MCHRFGKGPGVLAGMGTTKFKSLAVVSSNKSEASVVSALTLNQPGLGRQRWTPWVPLMENMVCGRSIFALSFCSTYSSLQSRLTALCFSVCVGTLQSHSDQ